MIPVRPPRLPRLLLGRALPADVRDSILGDLEELFQRDCATHRPVIARLRYLRQVLSFTLYFMFERWRRRERGAVLVSISWMDFTLAIRMLARYPGLTVIGAAGMAVAIAIAAGSFGILYTMVDDGLPLDEGDRIVAIQNWDAARNRPERRILHDYLAWRAEVKSIESISVYRQVGRNLIASGGQPETVRVAEMTAAGFIVPRVAALMGRYLLPEDERPGAAPVLVIGYDVWRARFASDPFVVGREVQLGDTRYTIVGVMPEGFAFPINHQYWVPLHADPARHGRRQGPELTAFGRLAPEANLDSANAELAAIGGRAALASPSTHGQLRPKTLPYTYPFFDMNDPESAWVAHLMQLLITLLLVVVCVNVAILVYARTATRRAEIAIRSALGASRGRIIGQLFAEALVLTVVAAAIGLVFANAGLKQVDAAMAQMYPMLPFWWTFQLSSGALVYVCALIVLAATIIGVVPAMKATGRRVQNGLKGLSAGSGSGMHLGKTWTALIVVQVGFAVALLPAAVFHAWDSMRSGLADPGFAAEEYLSALLTLDPASGPPMDSASPASELNARYARRHAELATRLQADPAVVKSTFALANPGEEATAWVEVEGVASPAGSGELSERSASGFGVGSGSAAGHEVCFNRVGREFFDVFEVPILTGRGFTPADATTAADAVIVNRTFVRNTFGAANPLGRRIRYVGTSTDATSRDVELGRWFAIVGIVSDFPARQGGRAVPKVYHASATGDLYGATLALRLRGTTPAEFAGRLREIAAGVDPNLQLRNVMSMNDALRRDQGMMRLVALVLCGLTLSVVALAAAGIYALMSFTVAQRRKEIGIRTALGADPTRILGSIFYRALVQLAIGAATGVIAATVLEQATAGELMKGHGATVLPIVALLMMTVGLLATVGPARRGLRIQPTEALRES